MSFNYYTYSDKGPRAVNEDYFNIKDGEDFTAVCIADGVGGSHCGKLAAETSVNLFSENATKSTRDLSEIVLEIHHTLKSLQEEKNECRSMATTFTGCIIYGMLLRGVHAGDSRLYILRGNGIKQLTEDQTEVSRLLRQKKIAPEDVENYPRKHVLESALGINGTPDIQKFDWELQPGDRVLFTSDGVHSVVLKVELRDLFIKYKSVNDFGNELVKVLSNRKLTDNYTFIAIDIT